MSDQRPDYIPRMLDPDELVPCRCTRKGTPGRYVSQYGRRTVSRICRACEPGYPGLRRRGLPARKVR